MVTSTPPAEPVLGDDAEMWIARTLPTTPTPTPISSAPKMPPRRRPCKRGRQEPTAPSDVSGKAVVAAAAFEATGGLDAATVAEPSASASPPGMSAAATPRWERCSPSSLMSSLKLARRLAQPSTSCTGLRQPSTHPASASAVKPVPSVFATRRNVATEQEANLARLFSGAAAAASLAPPSHPLERGRAGIVAQPGKGGAKLGPRGGISRTIVGGDRFDPQPSSRRRRATA
jgi:hypothetical protein